MMVMCPGSSNLLWEISIHNLGTTTDMLQRPRPNFSNRDEKWCLLCGAGVGEEQEEEGKHNTVALNRN